MWFPNETIRSNKLTLLGKSVPVDRERDTHTEEHSREEEKPQTLLLRDDCKWEEEEEVDDHDQQEMDIRCKW